MEKLSMAVAAAIVSFAAAGMSLDYDTPAGTWNEALPIGNGRLGAMVFDCKGAPLDEPVWVDLLTGRVYAFPKEDMLVHSAGATFVNVPAYDSPCVLTERAALKLQPAK